MILVEWGAHPYEAVVCSQATRTPTRLTREKALVVDSPPQRRQQAVKEMTHFSVLEWDRFSCQHPLPIPLPYPPHPPFLLF